jgi:hypothetical protein
MLRTASLPQILNVGQTGAQMKEKCEEKASMNVSGYFRGYYVWVGIALAAIGLLAEELIGGKHSFEFFMLFGGFFIGIGAERNRGIRKRAQSNRVIQPDQTTADR